MLPNESLSDTLQLQLNAIVLEAEGIASFEFRHPGNEELPRFTAGAHIDVHVDAGLVRQYSLCNNPNERHRYVIAVQREATGHGGSRAMHDNLRVGDLIRVSTPRNFFPLASAARRHLLIAGGIGITPMMAMVEELEDRGEEFLLHFCTRSSSRTPFLDRLAPLVRAGKAKLHYDSGNPLRGLDLAATLKDTKADTHLYYCGPPGFMEAAAAAAAHWPKGTVHFEHFSAPVSTDAKGNRAFKVRLVRSKLELEIPPNKSIVEVLREHDVFIETSCEQGYCGTCLTRYVEGQPEHRDSVLSEDDRKDFVLVCCARSKSLELVLDL
ncbi:MAG: oxidoreductase [Proteobacteria bacterium]|nr:MAG: oxidoreductase [Pseudomonadota bacterium]QKK12738.1 MAG: oxidoreductase [Pseudomonadota bacterium]